MYDNYTSLKGYMAPYGGHAAAMAAKKGELETNLARMDDVIRTYEHEFQERMQSGTARPGFWPRRGLVTSGDFCSAPSWKNVLMCKNKMSSVDSSRKTSWAMVFFKSANRRSYSTTTRCCRSDTDKSMESVAVTLLSNGSAEKIFN